MKGAWVIHFQNGSVLGLSEERYDKEKDKLNNQRENGEIMVEERWFNEEQAKEKYPELYFLD